MRLGCEVEASDLNPVAVVILKGTVEYPQKYGRPLAEQREQLPCGERDSIAGVNGQVPEYIREAGRQSASAFGEEDAVTACETNPLAADVRYWDNWMLEQAREELAEFYPPDPDGSVPVAYLWSRTVPCPNCRAEMPLMRQYWLARKDKKKVTLKPIVDQVNRRVDFEVIEGLNVAGDPEEATTSRGDTLCLLCRQVAKAAFVREASRSGRMGATLIAVVPEGRGRGGKRYRADEPRDIQAYMRAESALATKRDIEHPDIPFTPDEPIDEKTLGLRVDLFGHLTWGQLFNRSQAMSIGTFASLVQPAHSEMRQKGLQDAYADAVSLYLAFVVDRLVDYNSSLCRWGNDDEGIANTYSRQALSMVCDYGEANSIGKYGAGWLSLLNGQNEAIRPHGNNFHVKICQQSAQAKRDGTFDSIVTDPPYYNAVDYAGLSDLFYVWLKRSLTDSAFSPVLSLPLTPKRDQAIMASEATNEDERQRYVSIMRDEFAITGNSLPDDCFMGGVFAHSDQQALATLSEGLISADLTPIASWLLDTEQANKISSGSRANLQTSVWIACRPRESDAGDSFLGDVLAEMRPVIRDRLLDFWSRGIRGADFFISAIGPSLSVFGRHKRVLQPDGSEVTVRDFLDLVRRGLLRSPWSKCLAALTSA